MREEQLRLRPDPSAPLTSEVLNEAKYTRQVVKEILRFRPPAPMVPQTVQKPFKLTEDYTAPAGSMVIPSVWAACMQVGGRVECSRAKGHCVLSLHDVQGCITAQHSVPRYCYSQGS